MPWHSVVDRTPPPRPSPAPAGQINWRPRLPGGRFLGTRRRSHHRLQESADETENAARRRTFADRLSAAIGTGSTPEPGAPATAIQDHHAEGALRLQPRRRLLPGELPAADELLGQAGEGVRPPQGGPDRPDRGR